MVNLRATCSMRNGGPRSFAGLRVCARLTRSGSVTIIWLLYDAGGRERRMSCVRRVIALDAARADGRLHAPVHEDVWHGLLDGREDGSAHDNVWDEVTAEAGRSRRQRVSPAFTAITSWPRQGWRTYPSMMSMRAGKSSATGGSEMSSMSARDSPREDAALAASSP